MSDANYERAIELSTRGYTTELSKEKATDGEDIFVARSPELDGCVAQGMTSDEALKNLDEVRVEHIEHLLENNLPVPQPAKDQIHTTIKEIVVKRNIPGVAFKGYEDYLVRPSDADVVYSITPTT